MCDFFKHRFKYSRNLKYLNLKMYCKYSAFEDRWDSRPITLQEHAISCRFNWGTFNYLAHCCSDCALIAAWLKKFGIPPCNERHKFRGEIAIKLKNPAGSLLKPKNLQGKLGELHYAANNLDPKPSVAILF